MKSYTDLKQSIKLCKILSPESADMYYFLDPTPAGNIYHIVIPQIDFGVKTREPEYNEGDIPCWSLAALLNIMGQTALFKTTQGWAYKTYIGQKVIDLNTYYNEPIDACYEMILKLHELNLL